MRLVERFKTIGVLALLLTLLAACTEIAEPITPEPEQQVLPPVVQPVKSNNLSCQETFNYFLEVAHKIEGLAGDRPLRKWGARDGLGKEIFVYVSKKDSSFDRELFTELEQIVAELNQLTGDVRLKIIQGDPQTNFELNALRVYLGSIAGYKQHIEPSASVDGVTSDGFFVYHSVGNTSEIVRGSIWIDTTSDNSKQRVRHVIREELTQVLGLTNDSNRFQDSIFFQGDSETSSYSKVDRDLIRMLYHPDLKVNTTKEQSLATFATIDTSAFECSQN